MLKRLLTAALLISLCVGLSLANPPAVKANKPGQPAPPHGKMQPPPRNRAEIQKRIRTMKIWKLTDELDLSEDQAAKFFPKLNKFEDQNEEMHQEMHESMNRLGDLVWDEKAKESDITKLITKIEDLQAQEHAMMLQFNKDAEAILTPAQMGKLILFNQHFPEVVRDMIDEMAPGPGDSPPPRDRNDW